MSSLVQMQWGAKIPMRDGVQLNGTVYLPQGSASRAPAIFTLTPYVAQTYHEYASYFAQQGFPFVTVDVRGRGNSEGHFDPWRNDGRDGSDIVRWLAQQPWCDGQVAMWGGSYGGYVQWLTASQGQSALATIAPVAAPFLGVDFPVRSNIAQTYWMQWLTLVWGRTSQDKLFWNNENYWGALFKQWFESGRPFKELDVQLGNPSDQFQKWIKYCKRGEHWDGYNPTAQQYSRIKLPVLTVTGHFDGDQPGALEHYRQHLANTASNEHYLVIGPWDHAGTRAPQAEFCGRRFGPASLVDLRKLHVDWYTWTMRQGLKPSFLQNKVAYYVMGAERWRYAATLDEITARREPLYLHSISNPTDGFHSGSLETAQPMVSEPDHYTHDPRDISGAELESQIDPEDRADQRRVVAMRGRQLIYHSAPFHADTEISGFFQLSVWLSIDQPDADFRAQVFEIDGNGDSFLLTDDLMRARYRESLREEQLVRSTKPLRYDFKGFMFVSHLIKQGCRLRLVIGPVHSIHYEKNHHSGAAVAEEAIEDARVLTVKLHKGSAYPSALYIPFGKTEADSHG